MKPLLAVFLGLALIVACGDDDAASPGGGDPDSGETPNTSSSSSSGSQADSGSSPSDAEAGTPAPFELTGPWQEGASIPEVHTCEGADESPALTWSGAPSGTQSFAVVMRDTSLTGDDNYHWVIYDVPASTTSLAAGIERAAKPASPAGARQTKWSFSADLGYGGPCPPKGKGAHTYAITLYALDKALDDFATPNDADAAIQAAKLGSVTLTGTYER